MTTLDGTYFDGRSSRPLPVAVTHADGALQVRGAGVERDEPLASVRVSAPLAGVPYTLTFVDGARVQLPADAPVTAWFPDRHRLERRVDRYERRAGVAAIAALIVVAALFAMFEWGVPAAGDYAAVHLPASVDRMIGRESLAALRGKLLLPSTLPDAKRAELQRRFRDFAIRSGDHDALQLEFYDAPAAGANAFSLGGGIIVVTDGLVRALPDDDAFLAVVAHEMGHQHYRHALRMVLRGSGVAIVASVLMGDVSGGTIAAAMPVFLLNAHYSRAFEAQADGYALDALARAGISPMAFVRAMTSLEKAHPELAGDKRIRYLSSHPVTQARIDRALAAARAYDRTHHG